MWWRYFLWGGDATSFNGQISGDYFSPPDLLI